MLDRPNPAGRPVEGLTLRAGWESFVGAGPMPMRHGLTLGELGHWFVEHFKLDVDYRVIEMEGWRPDAAPGFGWPLGERDLGQPQPQRAESLDGARLCRHGDARRHDAVRRPRHDAAARAVRRARHRRARGDRRDARARAAVAGRLHAARLLVRADLPQACRQALQRRADPHRGPGLRSRTRSGPGGCRRSPSRRSAGSIRTTSCGAISPTSTSSASSPSTSSTAARCCANGSTIRPRRPATSTR